MRDIVFLVRVTDSELDDADVQEIQHKLEKIVRTTSITKSVNFCNTTSDHRFNEVILLEDKTIPELQRLRRSSGTR
jgi:hypothetical protein